MTSKKEQAKRGDPQRKLQGDKLWHFPVRLISRASQRISMKLDANELMRYLFVRALFPLTCKIIIAQKIATFSRENQTQFKIIGAIWWQLKQSKEMKLIKTTTTAVLFKQSALLSQHEDWKSTKLDSSAIFCKTISHCLCYEFKTYKYQRNTYNTICNLFKTMSHCIVRFPNHYFWQLGLQCPKNSQIFL